MCSNLTCHELSNHVLHRSARASKMQPLAWWSSSRTAQRQSPMQWRWQATTWPGVLCSKFKPRSMWGRAASWRHHIPFLFYLAFHQNLTIKLWRSIWHSIWHSVRARRSPDLTIERLFRTGCWGSCLPFGGDIYPFYIVRTDKSFQHLSNTAESGACLSYFQRKMVPLCALGWRHHRTHHHQHHHRNHHPNHHPSHHHFSNRPSSRLPGNLVRCPFPTAFPKNEPNIVGYSSIPCALLNGLVGKGPRCSQ